MKLIIKLFKLIFTTDNPDAVAAGLVNYGGQGR